jgi:hypothetical protein
MSISPDSLIHLNPEFYQPYVDAGNYWLAKGYQVKAKKYFTIALKKEIATVKERKQVEEKIKVCEK